MAPADLIMCIDNVSVDFSAFFVADGTAEFLWLARKDWQEENILDIIGKRNSGINRNLLVPKLLKGLK